MWATTKLFGVKEKMMTIRNKQKEFEAANAGKFDFTKGDLIWKYMNEPYNRYAKDETETAFVEFCGLKQSSGKSTVSLEEEVNHLKRLCEQLQHEKDSVTGLWATDKPLEAVTAEHQHLFFRIGYPDEKLDLSKTEPAKRCDAEGHEVPRVHVHKDEENYYNVTLVGSNGISSHKMLRCHQYVDAEALCLRLQNVTGWPLLCTRAKVEVSRIPVTSFNQLK